MIMSSTELDPQPSEAFAVVTIPDVALGLPPKGLAKAKTSCPTSTESESPTSTGFKPVRSTFSKAISEYGSWPITFASSLGPSPKPTSTVAALPITWLQVRMWPSSVQITPEPNPLLDLTLTTDEPTLSASSVIASENDCSICNEAALLICVSQLKIYCRLFTDED